MEKLAVVKKKEEKKCDLKMQMEQYYSVEFSVNGPSVPHQFKLWNIPPTPMCLLVKEDSDVLRGLKVGDTVKMKYYPADSASPSDYLDTAIRHIGKNDQERFKNHYLVGLEIVEDQEHRSTH
jgi:hypothetical protein